MSAWDELRNVMHDDTVVPTFDEFVGIALDGETDATLWWPQWTEGERSNMFERFRDGETPEEAMAALRENRRIARRDGARALWTAVDTVASAAERVTEDVTPEVRAWIDTVQYHVTLIREALG